MNVRFSTGLVALFVGLAFVPSAWATYDPKQGRFLQSDPIGYRGGMNLYQYVRSNPIRKLDPSGHTDVEFPNIVGMSWGKFDEPKLGMSTCIPTIVCQCKPTDPCCKKSIFDIFKPEPKYYISCSITVKCYIWLNTTEIDKHAGEKDPYGTPYTRATTYGHEQQHIYNMKLTADEIKDTLDKVEAANKCVDINTCNKAAADAEKQAKKNWDDRSKQNEKHGFDDPIKDAQYNPIGGVFPNNPDPNYPAP